MYRRFAFEEGGPETLEFMPLALRRKLDLARLKISLDAWRGLSFAERLALCHLPVASEADARVFEAVLRGFCERVAAKVTALEGRFDEEEAGWSAGAIPEPVGAALVRCGASLSPAAWAALDDEARYALRKLADRARDEAFCAALEELRGPGSD